MKSIDPRRIRSAIDAAEARTSGRIGVRVTDEPSDDTLALARADFERARLHEHPAKNAVIFLISPRAKRFAVFGGDAIHAAVGDAFWNDLVAAMTPFFARNDATAGVVFGITRVGERLREHFPKES
ncbi:MAG TPA: TPM domain-containing protein [Candidatus Baltobacteraceae bacterium]|nr:TPM domain-containing protein [Candidatus Baltobacteraceae bacterium]